MRSNSSYIAVLVAGLALALATAGCGNLSAIFNPAFINTIVGGQVPVTPGPEAAFVLVRCVNETGVPVEFIVTIQRSVLVTDDEGNYEIGEDGQFVTTPERETLRLATTGTGQGSEVGALFPCGESPVTHIGLGENLLQGDTAVFVDSQGTRGGAGFGVVAGDLNPLQLEADNFNCGDTIIFAAFQSNAVAGGVALQSFWLGSIDQPSIFEGPNTFVNLETFLESQVREDEP
ncbi:MAG: hypothetical protein PVI86_11845 [Phycisphaerae bacterium]